MNKKTMIILALCTVLTMLFSGCVTRGEQDPLKNATTVPSKSTEEMIATTEETVPGVINNPVDDGGIPENNTEAGDSSANDFENNNSANNDDGNSGNNQENKPEEMPPSTEETTQPEDGEEVPSPNTMSYETYNAMSGEAQLAFFNSFESVEDFVAWYNDAKAKYEAAHPDIEVGDGEIDAGDIAGGGN